MRALPYLILPMNRFGQQTPYRELVEFCADYAKSFDAHWGNRGYATTVALVVTEDGQAVIAVNDIPEHCLAEYTLLPRGHSRKAKHVTMGHAEQMAIAACARHGIRTQGAMMALNWFPCVTCSAHIKAAGFKRVVSEREPDYTYKPDDYDFIGSRQVLDDAGIHVVFTGESHD